MFRPPARRSSLGSALLCQLNSSVMTLSIEQSCPASSSRSATVFVGPAVFQKVFDRFDVGTGDRFYDHPGAYVGPWGESARLVTKSLLVTHATRGELGSVHYVIESRATGSEKWESGPEVVVSQRDFPALVTLLAK